MKKTHYLLTLFTIAAASVSLADDKDKAIAHGKAKFALCGACHGITGNGQPAPGISMAASFLESEILKGKPEVIAMIMDKGIKKENPAEFMGQIMMPLGATMSDEDVAGLITYMRAEFAKLDDPLVTAEQVKEWRAAEDYKAVAPQSLTRAELEKMSAAE